MDTSAVNIQHDPRISTVIPAFLTFASVERGFLPQTIDKYRDCLRQVLRMVGDSPVTGFSKAHVLNLKAAMLGRGHSVGRQVSILAALKGLLQYCRGELGLPVVEPELITMPRRPRRE